MDNKDTQKPRRPLPTPGSVPAQRPNTPIPISATLSSSVAPLNFYAKASSGPTRSATTAGTSHTKYIPPGDPPPYDSSAATPGFREPELVTEDTMDALPALTPSSSWNDNVTTAADWQSSWTTPSEPLEPYLNKASPAEAWTTTNTQDNYSFDTMDYMANQSKSLMGVNIDGRDDYEEKHWWDPAFRDKEQRPGPGMLPTVLAEELHDPDHSLFSVSVTSPDIKTNNSTSSLPPSGDTSSDMQASSSTTRGAWSSTPKRAVSPAPSTSTTAPPPPPPTESDVRTAVPHPNAYYCPKENGWVILSWKSSSVSPPLARSFNDSKHRPLPDQTRRRKVESCLADDQLTGWANKTHHFHRYEKAVDSYKLTPALRQDEWEAIDVANQKRRVQSVVEDIDIQQVDLKEIEAMDESEIDTEEEGRLLDLYICCQCSFYCVASGVIPGVLPRKCFDELVRDKKNNPLPGRSGEQAVVMAFETLIQVVENKLWGGENRLLRVTRPNFESKVGWNSNTKRIFDLLGFDEELYEGSAALRPPPTDIASTIGKLNRRKLLRTWVEFSAWLAVYKRTHAVQLKDNQSKHKSYVKIESAREMYQSAIGAHPDQIPRGELSETLLQAVQNLHNDWQRLGLTPMSYSSDLLTFAYYAQVRCDPAATVDYFTSFSNIVTNMQIYPGCPQSLPEILAAERSRDRFTIDDLHQAAATLGFGPQGPLGVDYDETDVPEDFLEGAWKECVKRSWRDPEHGSELMRSANEAFRILAEARGSESLRRMWESAKDRILSPEKAYDTLEVPKDVDDFMLITVYNMRMDELPSQLDKMRDAMTVIAEARDSQRLRQFIELGRDPGEISVPIRPDLPRGLNQLGNTCYLNSLLQYFYTIKDLRETVIPMGKLDLKTVEDEKLSDDDLKRHRVGGRLVTRREIVRSKKFINQLAELFFNMEYAEAAAITPSIDLAKLALVTSRDEEEDEAEKGGTDSSNDTDATLVDDAPHRSSANESAAETSRSPARSPHSILGKRSRDIERQPSVMDLDSPAAMPSSPSRDDFVSSPSRLSDSPPPLTSPGSPARPPEASGSAADVVMRDVSVPNSKPPPLPPRKPPPASDSVMMFGKQHDVAECMDNCIFQIETALLKFDGLSDSQGQSSDKTSVVKRLFYGKLRQRLTGDESSRSSVHEKEDLFSHLPVNVAHDGVDIYDGLSGYFDDIVEFNGEKRRMEVSLIDLPPVLQIQLQRVQFNRETLQPYKSQAYVKFGENLYMDRFMDNADPHKKAHSKAVQAQLNTCRERVRLLVEGKDGSHLSALEHTSNFMSKLGPELEDIDDDFLHQLNSEQILLKAEIDGLRVHIDLLKEELETIWRDNTEIAYELTSVFIHRGSSPSFGHYFFYSRHLPENPDSWFKYNDSDVTVVSKDEVLADTTGSSANPYLLVFARKGVEVVDTVKRFDPSTLQDDSLQ